MKFEMRHWAAFGLVVSLSGCAPFSAQRGEQEVTQLVNQRGVQTVDAANPDDCINASTAFGDSAPPSKGAESVLRLALLCSPNLAAEFARLGIANAEAFEAERLVNPRLTLGVADSNASDGGTKFELGLAQNFTNIILRGPRMRLAEGEFLRAQQLLAGSVLNLAVDVKSAYYGFIGAQQIAAASAAIAEAAAISAEMGARFRAAGNFSARELALINAASVEAQIDHLKANDAVSSARVVLHRLLGVDQFPSELIDVGMPEPLLFDEDLTTLRARADANRLDLAATRKLVELIADNAATTKRLRLLGEFEVGVDYEREPDHSRLLGPTLSIQLPLFHQGQGTLARVESTRRWSEAERRRLTLEVATAVDLANEHLRSARTRVEAIRTHGLPQRARVVARTQEDYNFMLRGVFELLDARVAEYEMAESYFEALRDYWIAHGELDRAVGVSADVLSAHLITADEVLGVSANTDHSKMDHSKMDHSKMDHSKMDHSKMDHSKMDHSKMDHSKMDHSKMDHSKMDHSKMDHSKMDHSKMDHSKMDHSKMDHSKAPSAPTSKPDVPEKTESEPDPHSHHHHNTSELGEQA